MFSFFTGLGFLGVFWGLFLLLFLIISGLMWILVPFWILSIKNSVKNIELYMSCPPVTEDK
jgi:hypothetical protein